MTPAVYGLSAPRRVPIRLPSWTSTSSAHVLGQSCGQAEWRIWTVMPRSSGWRCTAPGCRRAKAAAYHGARSAQSRSTRRAPVAVSSSGDPPCSHPECVEQPPRHLLRDHQRAEADRVEQPVPGGRDQLGGRGLLPHEHRAVLSLAPRHENRLWLEVWAERAFLAGVAGLTIATLVLVVFIEVSAPSRS